MDAQGNPKIKIHSILEDYEVKWRQKLGCGVSGPVRPCKRKDTGEQFALKCLVDRPRARAEVALHLKCSGHPHIVNIYDIYANEVQFPDEPAPRARLLVVMELMVGGELFDRISKQRSFTEQQAAKYTKEIALAIQRCHNLNVAHRDIKPENLLLQNEDKDARIKLSDFGFAKIDDGSLMTPHFTPYYVAPQVLQAMKQQQKVRNQLIPRKVGSPVTYDKSCDMWSLGVIVYIMLCGYPPFYSETPSKALSKNMKKKIIAGQYEFHKDEWTSISDFAKDLVRSLLTVDPAERLTVDDVLDHPWLGDAPSTALLSPAVLHDKETLEEIQQAHSEFLTSMRLPDKQVKLKPVLGSNNPILKRRKQSTCSSSSDVENHNEESHNLDVVGAVLQQRAAPNKRTSCDMQLQYLRDIVAHCILPSKGSEKEHRNELNELVQCVCRCGAREVPVLAHTLKAWRWDGVKFCSDVDLRELAGQLSKVIRMFKKPVESE